MSGFRGAVFDLDGTLLDSMWVWEKVDQDFWSRRGMAVPPGYMDKVNSMSFPDAARYTVTAFSLSESPEKIMEEWQEMARKAYRESVPLKPGVAQYLRELKGKGIRLSVATASNRELYEAALLHNGIYHLFDAFTTLREVERGKGYPDIYLRAAEKIGLPPKKCVVFEDILAGVMSAKNGGFYTVAVEDDYSLGDRERIKAAADLMIRDFTEDLSFLTATGKYEIEGEKRLPERSC